MKQYMELLGHEVKDRVSGFTGVVSSVSFDLYGCVQCVVAPKMHIGKDDGEQKLADSRYFDFKRLQKLSTDPVMERPSFTAPGAERGGDNYKPLPR